MERLTRRDENGMSAATIMQIEAQHAVLGSMLIDSACVGVVMAKATEDDFSENLQPIYNAFRKLYFEHAVIDPVAVVNIIGPGQNRLLFDLMQLTPTAANVELYLEIMKEQSVVRKASIIGYELLNARGLDDARASIDELNKLLGERKGVRIVSFLQGLTEFYDRHSSTETPEYLRWGISSLNKRLCAESGDFVILGGYPSSGKTVLAIQFAWEMAFHGKKSVGVFSLETKDEKVYDRLICKVSETPFDDILHNTISTEAWKSISELGNYADSVKLDIIKASGMSVNDIRAIALSRHYDIIIIDYLQLISSGGRYKGNRTEEVAGISMALHTFAQDCDKTVIALSQLTRADKMSKGTAPGMSSLRESGQLEQDADIIMLLYLVNEEVPDGDRRLKIAKNKNGERGGGITLGFDPKKMSFAQLTTRTDVPPPKRESSIFTEEPAGSKQEELPDFSPRGGQL